MGDVVMILFTFYFQLLTFWRNVSLWDRDILEIESQLNNKGIYSFPMSDFFNSSVLGMGTSCRVSFGNEPFLVELVWTLSFSCQSCINNDPFVSIFVWELDILVGLSLKTCHLLCIFGFRTCRQFLSDLGFGIGHCLWLLAYAWRISLSISCGDEPFWRLFSNIWITLSLILTILVRIVTFNDKSGFENVPFLWVFI